MVERSDSLIETLLSGWLKVPRPGVCVVIGVHACEVAPLLLPNNTSASAHVCGNAVAAVLPLLLPSNRLGCVATMPPGSCCWQGATQSTCLAATAQHCNAGCEVLPTVAWLAHVCVLHERQ